MEGLVDGPKLIEGGGEGGYRGGRLAESVSFRGGVVVESVFYRGVEAESVSSGGEGVVESVSSGGERVVESVSSDGEGVVESASSGGGGGYADGGGFWTGTRSDRGIPIFSAGDGRGDASYCYHLAGSSCHRHVYYSCASSPCVSPSRSFHSSH